MYTLIYNAGLPCGALQTYRLLQITILGSVSSATQALKDFVHPIDTPQADQAALRFYVGLLVHHQVHITLPGAKWLFGNMLWFCYGQQWYSRYTAAVKHWAFCSDSSGYQVVSCGYNSSEIGWMLRFNCDQAAFAWVRQN